MLQPSRRIERMDRRNDFIRLDGIGAHRDPDPFLCDGVHTDLFCGRNATLGACRGADDFCHYGALLVLEKSPAETGGGIQSATERMASGV